MTFLVLTLTVNEYRDNSSFGTSNAIISGASVSCFILITSDAQRKGDNTVIRESFPGDVWRWIATSCTVECHFIIDILCLVCRDVSDL